MKLNANIISKGKYWRSGEDVPTELVPPHIAAAYAAQDTVADEAATRPQPSKPAAATHIKVGSSWNPIAPGQQAPPGEGYIRIGKAFVRVLAAGQQ